MYTSGHHGINCKLRRSFYYFRRGARPSTMRARSIRSSVRSLCSFVRPSDGGCSRIADKHLVYLTRLVSALLFLERRCRISASCREGKHTSRWKAATANSLRVENTRLSLRASREIASRGVNVLAEVNIAGKEKKHEKRHRERIWCTSLISRRVYVTSRVTRSCRLPFR